MPSPSLVLLTPAVLCLYLTSPSPWPLLTSLCLGLAVYCLDLAGGSGRGQGGGRGGRATLAAVWLSLAVQCAVLAAVEVTRGEYNVSGNLPLLVGGLASDFLLLFDAAACATLRFGWLPVRMPRAARCLEAAAYSTLPLVAAATVARAFAGASWGYNGGTGGLDGDTRAILTCHLLAVLLAAGIGLVGTARSEVLGGGDDEGDIRRAASAAALGIGSEEEDKYRKEPSQSNMAVPAASGRRLSWALILLPPLVHVATFRARLESPSTCTLDDVLDLVLIATLPLVYHHVLASCGFLHGGWRRSLPLFLRLGTGPADGRTVGGSVLPAATALVAAVSFEFRYLVPLCARVSYIIHGHDGIVSPGRAVSFLTASTVLGYASAWFYGRGGADGSDRLLGEYHEDAFQLLLSSSAVCLGLSCGFGVAFLPVPVLLAVSAALWIITRQLRWAFLTIFVMFTVGSILAAYRLTFLTELVEIVPGAKIVLKRFAELAMYASFWLVLVVGLVHRAPGGYGEEVLKRYDVAGVCLAIYGLMLVTMEFALLKEPMPLYSRDNYEVGRVAVYSPALAYSTSFIVAAVAWRLRSQRTIGEATSLVTTSTAAAKALAVLIEFSPTTPNGTLASLTLRWAIGALVLVTVGAPFLLKPVYVKTSTARKSLLGPTGKPTSLPKNASSIVVLYCGVLLPAAIVSSVKLVIEPLVSILTGESSAYGYVPPKFSEVAGYSISLWGVSVLLMINHFLPSGGAEHWRKISALTFVVGVFLSFSAPVVPGAPAAETNVFQAVAGVGSDEEEASLGGWGLVAAFLAVLLALVGPLELRDMTNLTGRKDTGQLLRLMIFGLAFGCGLAWFVTMQSMSRDIFIPIFVTTFSCMAMATLGTVAAVMGYFLPLNEFAEAEQIANVWTGVCFPVFFIISSVSLSAQAHSFGIGGWASTYLSVCGLFAGAFCITVRMREEKNSTTRGYGNMSCVISWLCANAVVYGRYGVAGVGIVGKSSLTGAQSSVLGAILCSLILLLLEGEASSSRSSYSSSSSRSKSHGLVLPKLTRSNWFAPSLIGIMAMFFACSLYAVLLRGSALAKLGFLVEPSEHASKHSAVPNYAGGKMDEVAKLAKKSVVHTKTLASASKLRESGVWTASSVLGPAMNLVGLAATIPSNVGLARHSWRGSPPSKGLAFLALLLNILALIFCRGVPSTLALALIGLVGGFIQFSTLK